MNSKLTRSSGDGALLRRYEYDDGWVVAADLGVDADDVTIDTVGETAIVVVEGEGEGEPVESEFDIPGTADAVSVEHGVITIEGQR